MKEEIKDALGVPGHVLMYEYKTRSEWIRLARKSVLDAEKYGATKVKEMRTKEKENLRQSMRALGQNVKF